jgi:hypothetical protein
MLPNYIPAVTVLRRYFVTKVKRAVVLGGSLYSGLPQHFVHEVLPLLEVVYDTIVGDPEVVVLVEGPDVIPWLIMALPGLTEDRVFTLKGSPWNGR